MCCICLKENAAFNAAIKSSEEAPSSVLILRYDKKMEAAVSQIL
jgi:hypothetical protein